MTIKTKHSTYSFTNNDGHTYLTENGLNEFLVEKILEIKIGAPMIILVRKLNLFTMKASEDVYRIVTSPILSIT